MGDDMTTPAKVQAQGEGGRRSSRRTQLPGRFNGFEVQAGPGRLEVLHSPLPPILLPVGAHEGDSEEEDEEDGRGEEQQVQEDCDSDEEEGVREIVVEQTDSEDEEALPIMDVEEVQPSAVPPAEDPARVGDEEQEEGGSDVESVLGEDTVAASPAAPEPEAVGGLVGGPDIAMLPLLPPPRNRGRGGRGRGRGGRGNRAGPGRDREVDHPGPQDLQHPGDLDLPSLQQAHSTFIPTLKHIPRAAWGEFAREQAKVWHNLVADPGDESLWVLEAIMSRCILPACRGPRVADAYSQGRLVKERLRRWRAGEYRELWEEAVTLTKRQPKARRQRGGQDPEERSQEQRNAERARVLAQEGEYTRSLQALTSAGMATQSAATNTEMRAKHPAASSELGDLPTTDAAPLSFTQQDVMKAVGKFRRGSAPGPSGLRPEHLKCALKAAPNRGDRALEGLTKLLNIMVAGAVPESVAPFLCGARLHAALKKDGGIRPIAVGNLLRRLVAKLAARALADRAATLLSPNQLGVGVRGGCEAILHAAREMLGRSPEKWLLQVDYINAFNLADRATAMQEVATHFPEILAWVKTCYGTPSHLLFGTISILSEVGFHQGDALASLLFCLVLLPIVTRIREEVPTLALNAWYLDDGTQGGTVEELQSVVDILVEEGPARGLHLSTAFTSITPKSAVWSPNHPGRGDSDPLQRGIPREEGPGVILLGAPLGSVDFVGEAVKTKVRKIEDITALLPLLQDPHTEFVLLRACLALPKLSFTLRTVDTSGYIGHLQEFDRVTREALTRILGVPLDGQQWAQAKLPVTMGGMGLRGAEDHAAGAYTASFLASQSLSRELQGRQEEEAQATLPRGLLRVLTASLGEEEEEVTVDWLAGLSQKAISFKVDEQSNNLLKEQIATRGNVREVARLASVGLARAGAWLLATPIPALGLHLRPSEFIMAARYRLGCPVYDRDGPCPACLRPSDRYGDHALNCGFWGERITRHNHLRDHIHDMAAAAALGPVKEGRFLLPGVDRRPADVLIPNWAGGLDVALDITVVNPLQQQTVAEAAATPGHALSFAYNRKMRGAAEDCQRQGMVFLPIAVESLGGWHEVAAREVKKLAVAKARQTGQEEEEALRHAFTRLSILLMKGNAAILTNRIPTFPPAHVDGVQ
jgi:hypothetical protein